jgi:hypothetical protein
MASRTTFWLNLRLTYGAWAMPLASPKYPFLLSVVNGAPGDPGLYALYEGDEILCIGVALAKGSSDTIRGCLLAHLQGGAGMGKMPTHYQWEISSDPLGRRAQYLARLGGTALDCEDAKPAAPT